MTYLIRFSAFLTGVLFWGLCSTCYIERSTENYLFDSLTHLPNKEFALVLGANKKGKFGTNPYFQYRIDAATELYFANKVKKIIVSGDNHIKNYDETSDMANALIENGIPDSVIIRDYAGFRTLDSVIRAKKVFNCSSLIIVSQKFHNQRAVFIARHHDIDAIGFNSKDVNSKNNLTHLREIGAKMMAIIDVFVLNRQPKFL